MGKMDGVITNINEYLIRIPLNMIQLTQSDGNVWPLEFDWEEDDGEITHVKIDATKPPTPLAELKSGTVGDRYECSINGNIEYLYYSKIVPRKWFKVFPVTKEEYEAFYGRPDDPFDGALRKRFLARAH
jgi:hypothetical protein